MQGNVPTCGNYILVITCRWKSHNRRCVLECSLDSEEFVKPECNTTVTNQHGWAFDLSIISQP